MADKGGELLRPAGNWSRAMATLTAGLVTLALAAAPTPVAGPNVDAARSSVVATFKQEGVAVDAPFRHASGRIVYDPANVAAASASIEIDTGSFDLGDPAYNAEVRKKGWFDSQTFPKASFVSSAIKPLGVNRFEATGTLTVKGHAQVLTVPIAVVTATGVSTFSGQLTISRKAFGIGDPVWEDSIEDKVGIKFQFVAPAR